MARAKKPEPVHRETVCSLCGLDWDKHPGEPTVFDCLELLKVEAKKPVRIEYVPYYPWGYGETKTREYPTWTYKGRPTVVEPTTTIGKTMSFRIAPGVETR